MKVFFLLFVLLSFCSCDSKFQSVTLVSAESEGRERIKSADIPIYTYSLELEKMGTTNLSLYQLGKMRSLTFGDMEADIISRITPRKQNPSFGVYSQAEENEADTDPSIYTISEEETVTKVELHIPFSSHLKRDENGNLIKEGDRNARELNYIYGDENSSFRIKVEELTYYLGDLDVNILNGKKAYYSDEDYSEFRGEVLYDGRYTIDASSYPIYKKDDLKTEIDESKEIEFKPQIILSLDKHFFQRNIIDKEGEEVLKNVQSFWNYMRGLYVSTYDSDVMMSLNYSQAYIQIDYTYKKVNDNETKSNTSDDILEDEEGSFRLDLSSKVSNVFRKQKGTYSNTEEVNTERIYQKSPFLLTEIRLFDKEGTTVQDQIKQNKWLINDATLTFYIDRATTGNGNADPLRLSIFSLDDEGVPIGDHHSYPINSDKTHYKIHLRGHFNDLVKNESLNPRIGVMVTSETNDNRMINAYDVDGNRYKIPKASVETPLGAVFFGASDKVEKTKRLRLQVEYTESQN